MAVCRRHSDAPEQPRGRRLLLPALVPLASLTVHQLRYVLAFGSGASHELAEQGHSYLHELTPWIVLCCGLGLGVLLTRVAAAWRTGRADTPAACGFGAVWATAAAGLVGIYAGQEALEGLFATGHPVGLTGIFGDGGLWAIPAALAVGLALALVARGARKILAFAARRRSARIKLIFTSVIAVRPRAVAIVPFAPLAASAAGRAPPVRLP